MVNPMNRYMLFVITFFTLILPGCASTRDMARVVHSVEAEGAFFDKGTDTYNYYVYDGPGSRSVAYLAVDKKYTLTSEFWYETAMSKTLWQEIYRDRPFMQERMMEDNYRAKAIVSRDSQPIGYMLTRYYLTFAWFPEPGSTTLIVPPPELSGQQAGPINRWARDNND